MFRETHSRFIPLGRKVFTATLLLVLLLAILSAFFQFLSQRQAVLKAERAALDEALEQVLPSLIQASWSFNDDAIDVVVEALYSRPSISYVGFRDEVFEFHRSDDLRIRERLSGSVNGDSGGGFPAPQIAENCPQLIQVDLSERIFSGFRIGYGELTLCYDPQMIVSSQLQGVLRLLWPQILVILMTAGAVTWFSRRVIIEPVRQITDVVAKGGALSGFNRQRAWGDYATDEVDILVQELRDRTDALATERHISDAAFMELADGIAVTDAEFNVLRFNPAFAEMLSREGYFSEDGDSAVPQIKPFLPKEALDDPTKVHSFWSKSGRLIEGGATELSSDMGEAAYVFILRDRTDRQLSDEQKFMSQKMEAIGTLSGGIAHDFNNLLAVIQGNAELILATAGLAEAPREQLKAIVDATGRGADLTSQLLSFAGKQSLEPSPIRASQVLARLGALVPRNLPSNIRFRFQLVEESELFCDMKFLDTALVNLIMNARDSMPHGGEIELRARVLRENGHEFAVFDVIDQGRGMSTEMAKRVREPFFTTKHVGEGSGLGLPMVIGFAEQSKGRLEIVSEEGIGTRASLFLPIYVSVKLTGSILGGAHSTSPMTVIIVEDHRLVRETISRQLERLGHKAIAMNSRHSFLSIAPQILDEVDVILCDHTLEDANALDLLLDVKTLGAPVPFIVVVENLTEEQRGRVEGAGAAGILHKPVSLRDLDQALLPYRKSGGEVRQGRLSVVRSNEAG